MMQLKFIIFSEKKVHLLRKRVKFICIAYRSLSSLVFLLVGGPKRNIKSSYPRCIEFKNLSSELFLPIPTLSQLALSTLAADSASEINFPTNDLVKSSISSISELYIPFLIQKSKPCKLLIFHGGSVWILRKCGKKLYSSHQIV